MNDLFDPLMMPIGDFNGACRFLSNFYLSPIEFSRKSYATVEHAYQAFKTLDPEHHEMVRNCATAGKAKRIGRTVKMRDDWEQIKEEVMLACLRAKFKQGTLFAEWLLDTGMARLSEGNSWGDVYWGVCGGTGKDRLGHLLMIVRKELRDAGIPQVC